MVQFTVEEENLICMYHKSDRRRTAANIRAFHEKQKDRDFVFTPREGEVLKKGVIIRHMVLPSARKDSIALLRWMKESLPEHSYLISLMSQYTPFYRAAEYPEINRRLTSFEYDSVLREARRLDFRGYMQERSSAREEYTPPFDLTGI